MEGVVVGVVVVVRRTLSALDAADAVKCCTGGRRATYEVELGLQLCEHVGSADLLVDEEGTARVEDGGQEGAIVAGGKCFECNGCGAGDATSDKAVGSIVLSLSRPGRSDTGGKMWVEYELLGPKTQLKACAYM